MSELTDQQPAGFKFLPQFADLIAQAANKWAAMEYTICAVIWALADVRPALGACLTANIFTINGKMDALISLMKVRKVHESHSELFKQVIKFSGHVREAQEARNRTVHDYWLNDRAEPNQMGKLRITAAKEPTFRVESVALQTLQSDVDKIEKSRLEFEAIRMTITVEVPSFEELSQTELYPILETN